MEPTGRNVDPISLRLSYSNLGIAIINTGGVSVEALTGKELGDAAAVASDAGSVADQGAGLTLS